MNNENSPRLVTGLRAAFAAVFLTVALLIAVNPGYAAPPASLGTAPVATLSVLTPSTPVIAQLAAPAVPADSSLPDKVVAFLTPVLVPIVLAGVKKIAPSIPGWALPLAAPVLGFLLGVVNNLVSVHSTNLWLAAGLGLLGVAVREVKEAIVPAPNGGWPDPNKLP